MAMRFCDTVKIYRHSGDLYDPFAEVADVREETQDGGITSRLVYDGECKAVFTQSKIINEETKVTIYIDCNDTDVCVRDTAYLWSNGVGIEKKLQVTNVVHYERNTVITALFVKDGDQV